MANIGGKALSNIRLVHSRRMIASQITGKKFEKPLIVFKNGAWVCAKPGHMRVLIESQGAINAGPFTVAHRPDVALAKWAWQWLINRPNQR